MHYFYLKYMACVLIKIWGESNYAELSLGKLKSTTVFFNALHTGTNMLGSLILIKDTYINTVFYIIH